MLHAKQNTHFAGTFHSIEIGRAVHTHQVLIVVRQKAVPCGNESQRAQVGVTSASADGDVKDVDARVPESLEVGRGEAVRI
jgi:hypothetical protein